MNYRGLLTALLAAVTILAVGVTATGLDSVEAEPNDVFDIPEPLNELLLEPPAEEGEGDAEGKADGDFQEGDEGSLDQQMGEAQEAYDTSVDTLDEMTEGGGGQGVGVVQQLMKYLVMALIALGILVALLVAYLAYRRYGLPSFGSKQEQAVANTYFEVDTSNEVYLAWSEMVSDLHVESPHTKTPQEFAEAAVDEGMNPSAVDEITTLFEEVLYGDGGVTREQESKALDALERLDLPPEDDVSTSESMDGVTETTVYG
ncbi:MAG: DUF4129 domain-containing protein [Halobacteriota archaeon]